MPAEIVANTWWLGETKGFWLQSGAFFISAIGAILVIVSAARQNRRRATIDLALHELQNSELNEAKDKLSEYLDKNLDLTSMACGNAHEKPENKYIQCVLNNYEFIAAGIKEGAFDEEIYMRMKRSLLLKHYSELSVYIAEIRRATKRDKLFIELEWLAKKWQKKEIQPEINIVRRLFAKMGV